MLKNWKEKYKRWLHCSLLPFLIAKVGQNCLHLLLRTCRWKIEGIEHFKTSAKQGNCLIMLWHNRLAVVPFILSHYAPDFIYAAVVSNSRDGELISAVIHSHKSGRTIRVPHQSRHEALQEIIRRLKETEEIIIITPDGPRGPRYTLKPGVAVAALETHAQVFPLTWSANHFWELNTWDKLRIPKPFSTITVSFENPIQFIESSEMNLENAQAILQEALSADTSQNT